MPLRKGNEKVILVSSTEQSLLSVYITIHNATHDAVMHVSCVGGIIPAIVYESVKWYLLKLMLVYIFGEMDHYSSKTL